MKLSPPSRNGSPEAGAALQQTPEVNEAAFAKVESPRSAPDGASAAKTDRDSRGRFTAGNKGGPGNPFARKSAALRQALLDAVTPEDLQGIVRQLIQKAQEGDVAAARLVLSYTVGKPDKAVDPDTLDQHEWQMYQQGAIANPDLLSLLGALQAPLACTLLRAALPQLQEATAQTLAQQLKQPDPVADNPAETTQQTSEKIASANATRTPDQQAVPPPPEPKREAKAAPRRKQEEAAKSRQESVSSLAAASSGQAEGRPPAALDLEQEEEHWLAFLQEVARLTRAPQGPVGTGEADRPKANGLLGSDSET